MHYTFYLALTRSKKGKGKQMYLDLSPKEIHAAIKTHFDLVKKECGVLDYKEVEVEIREPDKMQRYINQHQLNDNCDKGLKMSELHSDTNKYAPLSPKG